MINAILFDLGGVLVNDVEKYMLADIAKEFGKDYQTLMRIRKPWWVKYALAEITHEEYWRGLLSDAGIEADIEDFLNRPYKYILEIDGMFSVVRGLKKQGYKLGILSNNSHEWGHYTVNKYGLEALFDDIVLSCDVQLVKPNIEIYRLSVRRLNINQDEGVFIENKADYLLPAKEVGLNTILFTSREQMLEEFEKLGIKAI